MSTITMEEALSENRLQKLAIKLNSIPTADEFKEKVEKDLWEMLVKPEDYEEEEIKYVNLPEKSKKIFGYILDEEGDEELPWWFTSFEWEVRTIGVGEETIDIEMLRDDFQHFVIDRTYIKKPRLKVNYYSDCNICNILSKFGDFFEELKDRTNPDIKQDSETKLELPQNIFAFEDGGIITTSEFKEWFESLAKLSPPFNEELTALLMMNTGVKEDIAREILPENLMDRIDNIGLVNDSIFNNKYFEPLVEIIRDCWKLFDLEVPYLGKKYKNLQPLEAALYESWLENNKDFAKKNKEWLRLRKTPHQVPYAKIAFKSPIMLTDYSYDDMSMPLTLRITRKGDYQFKDIWKASEIEQMLESYGISGTNE
ncbi:hypothetical protein [Methanococcoides methylutens]|uniref:Uncharacterized protein n=1 Tax=Methanococcoides methylutens MM1 TaxID=1434104 RepID=A0A0E3SQS8_METMT|nr:hypothetical protein [Methanococcoides methylutens]AKB84513.1 hypothetical protein MCMEM_0460 [Methanococcoides methylutens MM1]